ncbi:RHS repeat-associated core domain-containing protein [Pokkaliibacter sp. MBI-7]|uniref:RHS repeat-associated core domain-containing protein n=1 Tax=Pokkaliibacter sp. MBI-7 TaxID=3040600 RepID=UPI00244AFCF4|nr:RHS repeat-associated core domain-containing protein [Pokkaliibacter sp. MBI-7]MDH2434007.1 RHS repeat-associated core domain-containing protein [Pokkaliibacter sp. MBI-7]
MDNRYEWNDARGEVTVHFSDGSQQVYQHDRHAKLIRQTDPDGATVSKDYNDNGDLIREVDALGAETHYHYDLNGQLDTIAYPDGSLTHYDYWRGQLRSVRRGEQTWRYLRNEQGDLTEKTDPAGRTTRYHYTEQGQLSRIDLPDGGRHLFSWNRFGQLVDETLPDGGQRTYRYDARGRQVLRQDERGAITRYAYDKLNRLTRLTLPGGACRQYEYTAYGKVRRYTDEQGRTTDYDYAQPLHLVTAQRNPDGSTLRFRYDDRRLQLTDIENENGDHYRLSYHPSGLVKEETDFGGRTTRYAYDLNGRLTEKTDIAASPHNTDAAPVTLTTRFTRDVMGRLTEKILPDGQRIRYHYDPNGQLRQVDDGHWPLYFEYDAQGRLIAEHQQRHTLRYGYDDLGRLSTFKLPDGHRLHYHYGPHSQLSGIDLNDQPLTRHTHEYGQEVSRWQGALTSTWQYDEQGRLTEQQRHRTGQRGPVHQRRYQYNAVGNLITLDDSDKGTLHYDYDPLDRLKAVRGALEEQFHHDPAGNLLNQRDPTDSDASPYGHSAPGNRLTVQGDRRFEYDGFGNLITEYRGAGHRLVTRYQYDSQHRLSQVTLPNLSTVRYRYDAFGRRISKDIGGYLTTFVWQANRLIAETDDFSHYRSYLYEPGTYRPLAQLEGEGNLAQVYYYHLDHLGTPQEMTAANGERVWSVQYKAYGHVKRTLIEKVDTNLRFQGQYYDGETGLHYNRHRYYHPGSGHYLTPDPIKLAGGLNHYQYVPNPVNWVDPLGLKTGKAVPDTCPRYSDKQKAIIDELRAKYPDADPVLPDAQGNINHQHNAGERTPNFQNWHNDGGVVLYDAKTDQYIYATDMKTSTYGQKTVDVVYSPAADGNHYPDFSPYSYDEAELPNGVAVPKNREADYGDFYEALDRKHGEVGYSERVYGVKRKKDGSYPRSRGNNPKTKGEDKTAAYTPHHHENAKLMLMVDRLIHDKFKHKGGVSNANE